MDDYKFLTFLRIAAFAVVVTGAAVFAVFSGCVSPATSSVDGNETTSAASAEKEGEQAAAEKSAAEDSKAGKTSGEKADGESADEDTRIQAKASSMVAVAPSSSESLAKISTLLARRGDSEIAISKVNGTWIGTTLIDGTECPYVWVKDDNGAYYRVSFDTMDYAVIWDGESDRGTVEYHSSIANEYGRHIVVHLPESELGHFDGKSSDTTGNDEQRISGSVAGRLEDAAETDEEADDGEMTDKAANKE